MVVETSYEKRYPYLLYPESISRADPPRLDLARPYRYLKAYISGSIYRYGRDILHNLDSSLEIVVEIYRTKSNFSSKFDFKSDEDKNKHSPASCEGIVKFRHTLLVLPSK